MSCCRQLTRGITGIARAALGIDRADHTTIRRRRAICLTCDRATAPPRRCRECGCYVRPKTTLARERCPLGKW